MSASRSARAFALALIVLSTSGCGHRPVGRPGHPHWAAIERYPRHLYTPHSLSSIATRRYVAKGVEVFAGDRGALEAAEARYLGMLHVRDPASHTPRVGGTHFIEVDHVTSTSERSVKFGNDSVRCSSYGSSTNCTVHEAPTVPIRRSRTTYEVEVWYVAPEMQFALPPALQTPARWYL